MRLRPDEIHIWSTELTISDLEEKKQLTLLSQDESERAMRFISPIHRKRFIAARAVLREILGLYLAVPPQQIEFSYSAHKKPSLHPSLQSNINFNLAHSNDLAVYAFTLEYAIGIDIEKINNKDHQRVAEKYFCQDENKYLQQLNEAERAAAFYRIWCAKEAVAKATGKGLSLSLSHIPIIPDNSSQTLFVENETWQIIPLHIHPEYQAMLACSQRCSAISYWHLFDHKCTFVR